MKITIKRGLLLVAAVMTVAAPAVSGQTSATIPDAKPPAFDVVSVKLSNSGSTTPGAKYPPDGLSVSSLPLIVLIRAAYGMFNLPEEMIMGLPSWGRSQRFDIEAKMSDADVAKLKAAGPVSPASDQDPRMLMLQTLLADRFKMTVHKEMKVLPVYDLVIAKSGSKLKEATPGEAYPNGIKGSDGASPAGTMRTGRDKLEGQGISTGMLAGGLWQEAGRTVVDKTGLTGRYDVTLQWGPENHSAAMSADQTQDTAVAGPSIFTAIQEQLGLKLEPAKGPVDVLVIDHVEMPSAN